MNQHEKMESLKDSLDEARAGGDPRKESAALYHIGLTYRKEKVFEAAEDYWRQCEAVCRQSDLGPELAEILVALGDLLQEQGRLDEAGALFREALQWFRDRCIPQGQAKVLERLGQLAVESGDQSRALTLFREGLNTCLAHEDKIGGLYLLEQIIPILKAGTDLEAVETAYRDFITLADKMGDRERMALGLVGLADVCQRSGRAGESVPLLEMAHDQFLRLGKEREAEMIRAELAGLAGTRPETG